MVVIMPVHYLIFVNVLQDTEYTYDPSHWDGNIKKIYKNTNKVIQICLKMDFLPLHRDY